MEGGGKGRKKKIEEKKEEEKRSERLQLLSKISGDRSLASVGARGKILLHDESFAWV